MTRLEVQEHQFCKINIDIARQWYEMGFIKTTAYLLIIFDLKKAPDWDWAIDNVNEFCRNFNIKRASFYRAMTTLEEKGLVVNVHTQKYIVGKHRLFNPDAVSPMQHCLINETLSHQRDNYLTNETTVSPTRQLSHQRENERLEPLSNKDSGTLPDVFQIYSRSFSEENSNQENKQADKENKNGQYIDIEIGQTTLEPSINGQIKSPLRHSSGLDKFSAAPGRSEFLIYDGENTPWLNVPRRRNDIFFKPEFMEWHGRRWLEKFPNKRDIHEAIADFRSSLLNNPDKIPGRWEEYENHILHHAQNIQIRLEHGCQISESEQQKMIQHLPVINQPYQQQSLPPTAPEEENAAAYKLFSPPPAQTDISPEEQSENIKKLAELMRSKIKRIPKPKESETENRIDKLNRWLADPILKNEAIRQVLRDDSLIVFFDDNGDPYQVQEK